MASSALGTLTAAQFLRRYWQKQPMLARRALPGAAGILDRGALLELATRDDLESRLVQRRGRRWRVRHGPFARRELENLPASGWTVLVQGVNHAVPAAQRLLDAFSFIPYSRLDDVMASYAPAGGGVGPHFDEYDVFLLQGEGRRRWRVSRQRDLELEPGAPLRILRRFRPASEWTLEPGDLLYLPPRHAHDGAAAGGDCITYSIGFRAPSAQELGAGFLDHLQERLSLAGRYADPDLEPARRPARLDDRMVRKAGDFLRRIRWDDGDVASFLGRHLTEPKAHVIFERPGRPLSRHAFATHLAQRGVRLALPTRMLFRGRTIFINGEERAVGAAAARLLTRLADRRALPPRPRIQREAAELLYDWYRAGYLVTGEE
jgi:50S ribosomal protein L16 3-hydroxylase